MQPKGCGQARSPGVHIRHGGLVLGEPVERSRVLDRSWQALEAWGEGGNLGPGGDQEGRDSTETENHGGVSDSPGLP